MYIPTIILLLEARESLVSEKDPTRS